MFTLLKKEIFKDELSYLYFIEYVEHSLATGNIPVVISFNTNEVTFIELPSKVIKEITAIKLTDQLFKYPLFIGAIKDRIKSNHENEEN